MSRFPFSPHGKRGSHFCLDLPGFLIYFPVNHDVSLFVSRGTNRGFRFF
jgi:hypothetical protein